MSQYRLPADYIERLDAVYFDEQGLLETSIIHQPDVYHVADYLLKASSRTTIVDLGCGNGRKLKAVNADRHIGIDFGSNISLCRDRYASWGEWIESDLSAATCVGLAELAGKQTVIVCADVIEHLLRPEHLCALFVECLRRGAIVITSTLDRIRVRGGDHRGPPPNASHVREWALIEYIEFLNDHFLRPIYYGYTINNNIDCELKTIITIHDLSIGSFIPQSCTTRPLALMATYNEGDIVYETVRDLIAEGCEVVVIDNWSSDDTWSIVSEMAAASPTAIRVERFPPQGPCAYFVWSDILKRKADIARECPGRWIIHTDADEIRRSPFQNLTLADALYVAQRTGANRVNFSLINFRPTDGRHPSPGTLQSALPYFEYGNRSGHFKQAKAWLQGQAIVDLQSSGGHSATFSGIVDFPYKFLLKHYPIRSPEHGRRKVLVERQGRWSPIERSRGWHIQYDSFSKESSFLWQREELYEYGPRFWHEHGLVIITDLAERRLSF